MLTSAGRLVKLGVLDLPALPATANHPHLQGGAPVERVPARSSPASGSLAPDRAAPPTRPGLALGTRQGVVKRVNPEVLGQRRVGGDPARGRRRGGRRGRAAHRRRGALLHHHRRPAAALRRRRRPPAGPLRRRHRRHPARRRRSAVVWFGALDPATTRSWSPPPARRTALPGTEPGAVKVTPFSRVPRQGPRHRRRPLPPLPQGRGRPGLRLGRRRARPRAAAASGAPVDLPDADRPPRRLRRRRQPADRRLRRARSRAAVPRRATA